LSTIIFYFLTCRKHRTNLRRRRTIVLFSPHLFYIRLFPDLPRKIQGFQEGFSRSKGPAEDSTVGSRGNSTCAAHLWDRSHPPLMMSRCNRRFIDRYQKKCYGILRERFTETRCDSKFYNFKALSLNPPPYPRQNHNFSVYYIELRSMEIITIV